MNKSEILSKKKRGYASSALILATAGMVAKIIGAIYRIPLTNILGAEGIGIYQLVFPIYALMLTLSSSAIPTAISRLVSEKNTLGDLHGEKKVLKTAGILLFSLGVVFMLVMYLLSSPLASIQGNNLVKYGYYVVAPSILFVAISSFFKGWFWGNMNMLPTASMQIIEQVMKMIFGLLFAYILRSKGIIYAVTGALIGLTLSEFLSMAFLAVIYLKDRPKGVISTRIDMKTTSMIVKVSMPIMVSSLIFPLVQFVDSLLIVNLLTYKGLEHSVAVGEYGILTAPVNSLINMPIVITLAFAVAIVPIISSKRASRDIVSIKDKSTSALKLSYLFSMPCFVGVFILSKPLMRALYPSFSVNDIDLATILLMASSISIVLLSVQQVYTSILQALGKSLAPAKNLAITAIVKIMLDILLIYTLGIIGACISSVIAYIVGITLNYLTHRKLLGKSKNLLKNVSKITLSSVIISLVVFSLTFLIRNSYILIIVSIVVSVPIYMLLIIALGVLSNDELRGFPFGKLLIKIQNKFRRESNDNSSGLR